MPPRKLTTAELKDDVEALRAEIRTLTTKISEVQQEVCKQDVDEKTLRTFGEHIDRLELLVNGDPSRDVEGIRPRLDIAEAQLEEFVQLKRSIKYIIIGMSVSGVTGLVNAGSLIALLAKLLGGP